MKRSHASFAVYSSLAVALGLACSPDPLTAPPPSTGGTTGTGATGGSSASSSGGVGNLAGTGMPPGAGSGNVSGTVGKGGTSGAAGTVAAGGSTAGGSAGTVASGGTAGTGVAGTAGTAGTGTAGTAGTAGTGTAGTGGANAVLCDAPWDVNSSGFVRTQAMGGACWSGYAFAGADMLGSTAMPTTFSMCPTTPCELCFAGEVIMDETYASTAYIGFNIGQPASGGTEGSITPTGTGLTVTFSNGTGTPLRLQIANGDSAAQRWCADITTSPAQVPYTSFNTTCWEPTTGTAYAKTPIKAIQIIVPGDAVEARPYDVCINSVAEY